MKLAAVGEIWSGLTFLRRRSRGGRHKTPRDENKLVGRLEHPHSHPGAHPDAGPDDGLFAALSGRTGDRLYMKADRALYQAKHAGRNRVALCQADPANGTALNA